MAKIPWYVARSAGLVGWALILLTIVWGLLLATRVLGRRPAPAWLLSLHRYLGGLATVFVGVHVAGILLDSYVHFSLVNVLLPFTGTWHPLAVAWGIVAMYLLVAIEVTSLLRRRLSNRTWHAIHLLSYFLFAASTVHMVTAGTDAKAVLASGASALLATVVAFGSAAVYLWRSDPEPKRPLPARQPARADVRRAVPVSSRPASARQPNRHAPRNTDATSRKVGSAVRP